MEIAIVCLWIYGFWITYYLTGTFLIIYFLDHDPEFNRVLVWPIYICYQLYKRRRYRQTRSIGTLNFNHEYGYLTRTPRTLSYDILSRSILTGVSGTSIIHYVGNYPPFLYYEPVVLGREHGVLFNESSSVIFDYYEPIQGFKKNISK